MNYLHWHELSADDQAQSRENDRVALATKRRDLTPPLARVQPESKPARRARGSGPRQYACAYVGVTKVKGRWVGMWGPRGATQGPRRPLTDDGMIQAAWDRAQALERDYLEMRQ